MKSLLNKKILKNTKAGFTLVELLITITIFVIVTGVVLVKSNTFDSSVLLNNFAYDVALTIKQAQSYGVNVRESSNIFDTTDNLFGSAYGVYFDVSEGGGSRFNYVLFNDTVNQPQYDSIVFGMGNQPGRTGDYIYNGTLSSCLTNDPECVQKYSLKKGTSIESVCTMGPTDTTCLPVGRLSIIFQRPRLEANIYTVDETNGVSVKQKYAKITLSAQDGSKREVVITATGQIYVKK